MLAGDGKNYKISVTCGPDAGVPEGAELEVDEILPAEALEDGGEDPYQDYAFMLRDTLGWESGSASYLRLFDIRIVDRDGRKVVISGGVDVKIELADMETGEESDLRVVHFADGVDRETWSAAWRSRGTRSCSPPPYSPPMPSSRVPRFFLWAGPGFPPWRR